MPCLSSYNKGDSRHFKRETLAKLGLESLENRRWLKKLCFFLKIFKNKSLDYLYGLIP